jgi:uncharacterized membrane protein (UPF0127 family)
MPHKIEIFVNDHPLTIPIQAIVCDTFLCRLRGLMFRHEIADNEGLLLVQGQDSRANASIHMMAVFFDLAVIWIDTNLITVDIILAKSWHPAYLPKFPARYTLEIHPHRISEFKIGDRVTFNDI